MIIARPSVSGACFSQGKTDITPLAELWTTLRGSAIRAMVISCSLGPYCSTNHLHYIQVRVFDICTVLIHVHTLDNDSVRGLCFDI